MNITKNQYMIRQKAEALYPCFEGFLRDCKARDLSPFTIEYYRAQLAAFEALCRAHDVTQVRQITADLMRSYLLHLEATGNNPGGRYAKYRAMRAFLRWYQNEAEPVKPKRTMPPRVYVWNCQYCGREFESHSHAARYGCKTCREYAYRERKHQKINN